MANLRNEFEFRSALLTALGQEHTEAEAKNEEMWRRKMLDGLGVEYDQNDVNQFGLFREKLIEGVTNKSEGGGSGGGSSDFSTAEVTVNNTTENFIQGRKVQVYDTPISGVVPSNSFQIGSRSCIVPLYKGTCYWYFTESANVSVSGDIEWDSEKREVRISGNGTITIS